jgi:DNA mismatch repair protein MutL
VPRIAMLPSEVADQIAAGEVVERPASVVKELLENALDAGATTVDIDLEEGGRRLVRVSDDGSGMDAEDARLAIERHATSKIRTAADLVGVRSFGFRGEALSAICSVSRFTVTTATADGAGTHLQASGGTLQDVSETARRRGTTVSVADLFFNTPARARFLRGNRSEWRATSDVLTSIALARRDVRLRVTSDGKEVMSVAPARSLRDRVAVLWGADVVQRFLDVDAVTGPIRVSGLAERPADVGTASRRTALIVNGRAVRDLGLTRAAETAYRTVLPAGLRPSFALEITLPGDEVDVNVHPAKAEVRFHDRWNVEKAVERAVRRTLGAFDSSALVTTGARIWHAPPVADAFPPTLTNVPVAIDEPFFADGNSVAIEESERSTDPQVVVPPLLQLRRTYLLYEHADGVVLIDQHSAHERVLYERFMQQMAGGGATSQRLLLPETVHLSPRDAESLEANRDAFARLGFELEPFGGYSVIVHAVPTPHRRFDALRCLRESLAALSGDRGATAHSGHELLVATVACKAAVKAGEPLAPDEMQALFRALVSTMLPAHDVHGRSGIIRLTWDELDRRFGRR